VITHPGFALRRAHALRRAPYVLVAPKVLNFDASAIWTCSREIREWGINVADSAARMGLRRDWKVLDMAENGFYVLSDAFIEESKEMGYYGWDRHTMASDGGLIYALYHGPHEDRATDWETQLVASNVRKKQLIKVSIWEIRLAEKEVVKVAEPPKYAKYPRRMLDKPQNILGTPVVAVGCGDSIVVSSLLRCRVRFNLVRKSWEELPTDTGHMYETNRQSPYERQGIFAGILDLDMRQMGEATVTEANL
jgi:hypothetical protein